MEAALAEMTTDDVKEAEDDNDFFVEKGAQMVFHIIGSFCDGFNFFQRRKICLNRILRAQMRKPHKVMP